MKRHHSPTQSQCIALDPTSACDRSTCHGNCGEDAIEFLLREDVILGDAKALDVLLDLRLALDDGAKVPRILDAYFRAYRYLGNDFSLSFFRIRRWLENSIRVRVTFNAAFPAILRDLDLSCGSYDQLVSRYRRECFEQNLNIRNFVAVRVHFVVDRVAEGV